MHGMNIKQLFGSSLVGVCKLLLAFRVENELQMPEIKVLGKFQDIIKVK
jgi:hypothetical protein